MTTTGSGRLMIAVAAAALTSGCGLGLMAPVVVEGQAFRYEHGRVAVRYDGTLPAE